MSKTKKDYFANFVWDWKEWPPVLAIIEVARKHPKWKLYTWDTLGDWAEIIMAESSDLAKQAYREIYAQSIRETEEDGEEFDVPVMVEWKDE